MCGDFTFTVQPRLLGFNTVTCPVGLNHATVAEQHKCFLFFFVRHCWNWLKNHSSICQKLSSLLKEFLDASSLFC